MKTIECLCLCLDRFLRDENQIRLQSCSAGHNILYKGQFVNFLKKKKNEPTIAFKYNVHGFCYSVYKIGLQLLNY